MANILVVDDDEAIRSLLRSVLETLGHIVLETDDGDKAIHTVTHRAIDLCIMDIVMRRKGGLDAAEEIRSRGQRCGIILMSGIASLQSEEFKRRVNLIGVRHCLSKPFTKDQMTEAVADALRSPLG